MLTSGSDVFLSALTVKFADKYLTNKITVDGAIKIIIKTEEGKVVATKYINDYTDKTILDNGVIQFSPSNIHKKVKLNNKFLRLEVKSICDRTSVPACDFLPTVFFLLSLFVIIYVLKLQYNT